MSTPRINLGLAILLAIVCVVRGAIPEADRLKEYHARNYTWPIKEFVPNTPGWKRLMEHRFRQALEIEENLPRWEAFLQTTNMAVVAPNFTEHGFALARAPDDLMEDLRQGIREGVAAGPRLEGNVEVINGLVPWFIDRPDLRDRVLNELQHYPETWVGMELTPSKAYGFRLYRNDSQLVMHIDRAQTHIISFILHIDSSDDADPWPIVIEDYHGNSHEVILKSGDMLFYESSKVLHGRPHRFNGSWYSSVFVHYYPKFGWAETDHNNERIFGVPPVWMDGQEQKLEIPLKMVGTGLTEPSCPNEWCQTQYTKKWSGPGEDGYLILPNGDKIPFDPKELTCEDLDDRCEWWASWESNECSSNSDYMLKHCRKSCKVCSVEDGRDEL